MSDMYCEYNGLKYKIKKRNWGCKNSENSSIGF